LFPLHTGASDSRPAPCFGPRGGTSHDSDYPDKPKEPGVVPARLRSNIALALGDSYEISG